MGAQAHVAKAHWEKVVINGKQFQTKSVASKWEATELKRKLGNPNKYLRKT